MTPAPPTHVPPADYLRRLRAAIDGLDGARIEAAAEELLAADARGGRVYVAGNGGSATTATHVACDLVKGAASAGRPGLRAHSLTDNLALLTAISNDHGYEHAFSDQLAGVIGPGDVLMVLSVRGRSPNVLNALRCARDHGARTIALVGEGGEAACAADVSVVVPEHDYGIVEDVHLAVCHLLTGHVRAALSPPPPPAGDGERPAVLIVSANESAPWGASEVTWYQMALRLAERGQRVVASVRRWPQDPPQLAVLEAAGVTIVRRRGDWAPGDPAHERPVPAQHAQILEDAEPDLTLLSQGDNWEGWAWLDEAARRGLPYVVVSHSAADTEWPDDELAPRLRRGYEAALECWFISEGNRRLTESQIGADLPNAAVIRPPYAVPYEPQDVGPLPHDGPIRLACVARLDPPSKGHDLIFEVLAMDKWRERPLTVTLYGAGGHREVLQRMVRRLELDSVEFGGFAEDVTEIWRTHHGLLLASRCEGLPAVIVESMLCGRVAIVTDVAGNPEMVRDGETGFVAAAPTVQHLDEALERAWAARSRWPQMGERARAVVRGEVPADPVGRLVDRTLDLAAARAAH